MIDELAKYLGEVVIIAPYIFVQPAISNTVPLMSANVVGVPPFKEPNINVYLLVEILDISNAYNLPSRDTFDQKYCENKFKLLVSPELLGVSRKGLDPSVLSLYNPSLLVSPLTPCPILFAVANNVLFGSITRTVLMARVELVRNVFSVPPVAG